MHPLVSSILKRTSDGLYVEGFEKLVPGIPYLFVANHRDIVLDSAILQVILFDRGHETTEITFGSNLMVNQFVVDLGRVNRMFRVERGGNKSDFINNSRKLSAYIRHTITRKRNSVWIAQRPGRTKNGNDKTEAGLLKMFNMSGGSDFADSFRELNIVPVVISYEYEPCCAFKIREALVTMNTGSYKKRPEEDLLSIITGITQPKGRIAISAGRPANEFLDRIDVNDTLNNKLAKLAEMIDAEVYMNYRLWPGNYIAFDIMKGNSDHSANYSEADKRKFLDYMDKEIRGLEGNQEIIKDIFLGIYANPVINSKNQLRK
jgi:1-acyl-sn-glycerol-3-phosphate acyltransferase